MNLSILPNLVVVVNLVEVLNLVILGVSCDSREFDDICEYDNCVDYGETNIKFCGAGDINLSFLGKGRGHICLYHCIFEYMRVCM